MNEFFHDTVVRELERFVHTLPISSKAVPDGLIDEIVSRIELIADDELSVERATTAQVLVELDTVKAELASKNSELETMLAEAKSRGHKEGVVEGIASVARDLKKSDKAKKNGKDIALDLEKTLDISYKQHPDKGK
jgi:uncharacterized protein (UPF0335 family)